MFQGPLACWTFIHHDCLGEFVDVLQALAQKAALKNALKEQGADNVDENQDVAQLQALLTSILDERKKDTSEKKQLEGAPQKKQRMSESQSDPEETTEDYIKEVLKTAKPSFFANSEDFKTAFQILRNKLGAAADSKVFNIDQYNSDLIEIEAGWFHAVQNLRPNVKLAWDLIQVKNVRQYVASWKKYGYRRLKINQDYALLEYNILKLGSFAFSKTQFKSF